MPDEKILRAKAREAIRTGKLPSRRPDRTWGGPGVGAPARCAASPYHEGSVGVRDPVRPRRCNPGLDKFHIHVRCFAAWEFERDRDGRPHS